jgi:hypothetical protein
MINNPIASSSTSSTPQIADVLNAGGTNVSTIEFEYLNGSTSNIQDQFDSYITSDFSTTWNFAYPSTYNKDFGLF